MGRSYSQKYQWAYRHHGQKGYVTISDRCRHQRQVSSAQHQALDGTEDRQTFEKER